MMINDKTNEKYICEVIYLQSKKAVPLSGENNKRLKAHRPTNNASTAAWADIEKLQPESKVSTPSLENVVNAKEWVDNGSRL